MFDTLILTTTANVPDEILKQWNPPKVHHHDHDNKVMFSNFKYQNGGSSSPLLIYTPESGKLRVSIPSLPRFCLGTSAIAIDDDAVPSALEKVQRYVADAGVQGLPDIRTWQLASADIYHDIQVGKDVANYIDALSYITVFGYKTVKYAHETVSWRRNSGGRDIKFYDREAKCRDQNEDQTTIHFSQGVIRFEVQTNAYDYRRVLGITDIGSIFNSNIILPMLNGYLGRLDLDNLRITTLRDIETKLTAAYSQQRALAVVAFLQAQARGTILEYNRSTIYRYKRDLRSLNIAPVIGIRRLPSLQIGNIPNTAARLAEFEVNKQHHGALG